MRLLHQFLQLGLIYAFGCNGERSGNAKAAAILTRSDADCGCHCSVFRQTQFFLASYKFQRAEEAGGIANRKKLLGIGAEGAYRLPLFQRDSQERGR